MRLAEKKHMLVRNKLEKMLAHFCFLTLFYCIFLNPRGRDSPLREQSKKDVLMSQMQFDYDGQRSSTDLNISSGVIYATRVLDSVMLQMSNFTSYCKSGKQHKTCASALCTVDDTCCFHVIRLGPKTSECEKNVTVVSTVKSCDVTYWATTLHGFNKHASSSREAVSDSRGVPRCTEKNSQNPRLSTCVDRSDSSDSQYVQLATRLRHSFPSCQLPGELVSLSFVPIPSIDINLQNRSRLNAFVPISLGFTSVLTDDIVSSFRNTKS